MCAPTKVDDIGIPSIQTSKAQAKGRRRAKWPKPAEEAIISQDFLAVTTIYTKLVLFFVADSWAKVKSSKIPRTLAKTTQPAHLIMSIAVLLVCQIFYTYSNDSSASLKPRLANLIYLGAFATHFGTQIWMTFVSGLALYFALPRHTFGEVQQVIFPKYFMLNSVLSVATLAVFVQKHKTAIWELDNAIQAVTIAICFMLELFVSLYVAPPMVKLLVEKNRMETKVGVGKEIGQHSPGMLSKCPKYVHLHRTFRRYHSAAAGMNVTSMALTMVHLYYLSSKLCV